MLHISCCFRKERICHLRLKNLQISIRYFSIDEWRPIHTNDRKKMGFRKLWICVALAGFALLLHRMI